MRVATVRRDPAGGVMPTIIQWPESAEPWMGMTDPGCRLEALVLGPPDPARTRNRVGLAGSCAYCRFITSISFQAVRIVSSKPRAGSSASGATRSCNTPRKTTR